MRNRMSGPVIAIVGSVGKTGTKDAIGTLVRQAYSADGCFVTYKSLNAELGVPLTMLGFQDLPHGFGWLAAMGKGFIVSLFGVAPKCMVLELGEENPGDIALFSRLARPTHVIITDISEAHSAYLGDMANIEKETLSVLPFVEPGGMVIVNGDSSPAAKASIMPGQTKVQVKLGQRADYFMSSIKVGIDGTSGILHHANRTQKVAIRRYGAHQMYAVLFMAALGDSLGISQSQQLQAFKSLKPLPGRGTLLAGKRNSFILDESYNAQPAAMHASLELLRDLPGKKKVAILGDMRELKEPISHHKAIGALARDVADYVIAVGSQSKLYQADEWFLTSEAAIPSALRQLAPDVIVLVKGGQNTIRLERLVKGIMQNPEEASKKLVRQEPHWLRTP